MIVGFASTIGGCKHYRCELPARTLALHGEFEIVVGGDLAFNNILGSALGIYTEGDAYTEPDVIVLAGGYPVGLGAQVIEIARAHGQVVICDCDDWPWLPSENPHYRPDCGRDKLAALRAANAVTCSTPFLHDGLLEHSIESTMIRNTIDRDRYRLEREINLARAFAAHSPIVVGYRGVLAGFHDDDVRALGANLPTEGFRYKHVGSDPRSRFTFAELAGLPAELVDERQAVEFDRYGPELAGVDVAIIPWSDRQFSCAASAIAALEWHAAGVPWIASTHPEFELAGNGRGLVTNRAHWWHTALIAMLNPGTRHELYAAQHPPLEPAGAQWAAVVLSAFETRA